MPAILPTLEVFEKFISIVKDLAKLPQLAPQYQAAASDPYEISQLKFSCGDISAICQRNIAAKFGNWFTKEHRREEVQGTFETLSDADPQLVVFTYDHVVRTLDQAVAMETSVENGALDGAESVPLNSKTEMRGITERLESFAGSLSDLVISVAGIARAPVTLART